MSAPDDSPLVDPVPPTVAEPVDPAAEVGPARSPAGLRFLSCRWRRPPENGSPECCVHRDVLPMAGTRGFNPDAWCPECGFFKVKRTPKKRAPEEDFPRYYY